VPHFVNLWLINVLGFINFWFRNVYKNRFSFVDMKRLIVALILIIVGFSFVSAQQECDLDATLINQDPYPALPGDYVKVVFQLSGGESPQCGTVVLELIEDFPFSLNAGENPKVEIRGGTYAANYESSLVAPYNIIVHEDALDGDNPIRVRYYTRRSGEEPIYSVEEFNISVEDVRTDFELSIREYDNVDNILTFEILNIGEHDVEALTIEIPKQDNIIVKGSNRNIVGSLDSNEDTTFSFEAVPRDGEIKVRILYTDEINVRREIEKPVVYDSSYFTDRKKDEIPPRSTTFYVIIGAIALILLLWLRSWWKKRKRLRELHGHRRRR